MHRSSLLRRIGKLELRREDSSGLVPYSEAWFTYYVGQFDRMLAGDRNAIVPLAVIDRIVERADSAELEERRGGE